MASRPEKAISWLLRHGAVKEKIDINDDGYVLINDLLSWLQHRGMNVSLEQVHSIISNDSKGRFSIQGDSIRANQGHSINLKISLQSYNRGHSQVVHATYYQYFDSISKQGLKKMSRDYVHLINIDSQSNKFHMIRQDTDLYVFIQGDHPNLSISENGVILSPDISPKCLTLVPAYEIKPSGCYGFIIYNHSLTKVLMVKTVAGILGFPKGKIKKGELPLCCAFRELKEETNLDPEDLLILPGCQSEVKENGHVPTNYYLAKIREPLSKELYCLDQEENLQVGWMTIPELMKIRDNKFYSRRKKLLEYNLS